MLCFDQPTKVSRGPRQPVALLDPAAEVSREGVRAGKAAACSQRNVESLHRMPTSIGCGLVLHGAVGWARCCGMRRSPHCPADGYGYRFHPPLSGQVRCLGFCRSSNRRRGSIQVEVRKYGALRALPECSFVTVRVQSLPGHCRTISWFLDPVLSCLRTRLLLPWRPRADRTRLL